jgi:uncharacterized membrane protein YdjX (TVP38/TMEM64 family)
MTDTPSKKPTIGRFLPILLIALGAVAFILTGAHRYLSLETLREHRAAIEAFVADQFFLAILIFALAYVGVTALSLPGASIMSLAGGFLFGPIIGTAAVVAAATVGAVIIFSAARSAIGDSLRKSAGPFAAKMEEGFRENAFSYLLLLRLIPVFPFFIVNIAPALFNLRLGVYALATFIGIIPGAFAYVSAGNGLGAVLDKGGELQLAGLLTQPAVLTPIIALSVLALLPIVLKALGVGPGARKAAKS